MRYRKIPDELIGTPEQRAAWKKKCEEERRKNIAATNQNSARRRLEKQLTLNLDVPKVILCPSCHGMGCKDCRKKGVVQEETHKTSPEPMLEEQPSVSRTVECSKCWGVGKIANREYKTLQCPVCGGSGRVAYAPDD